jgi:HlyD family secretion protein
MQIDTNVDESDIGRIKLGQNVDFSVDAYPDVTFKGAVAQIRNAPITVQNVVTYDVVVKVDNPELKLKPGMTANVTIIIAVKKDAVKVPNAALRFRPAEKERAPGVRKGQAVYILENEKPKRISVAAGTSDGNFTEIVTGEIREGQEVILEALGSKDNKSRATGPPRMF